jgi:autotransporter-associated beta strand protein
LRRIHGIIAMLLGGAMALTTAAASAQERALGIDISYWNTGNNQSAGSAGIPQSAWNTAFSTGNRKYAWIRATRGGTTGLGQTSGTPGGGSQETLKRRYDDPRFIQNITRATAAGMMSGAYHFARPDIVGNTGADEATHFIQMAGPWMRPGYLMPIFDLESGTGGTLMQFTLDFSNQIYETMKIRPGIYLNGNFTNLLMQGSTQAQRDALAKPISDGPSMVGPAYPMLWNARYPNNDDPGSIPIQTGSPKTTPSNNSAYYGAWDDYGDSAPWAFWQYASTLSVPGINTVDSGIDGNVSQGDLEFVRNYLIPAVWWNDQSGDWSALANWNSGQTPIAPVPGPGQATPFATGPLPTPRLPGAAGSGPASGQYDTVILERPAADITVSITTGSHNVRKLYMRESLAITGGSLTINYDPTYRPDNSATVRHAGPISAQFSGPVTLGGTGSLNVHTLQVDAAKTFELAGGTLSFNSIKLNRQGATPATILVSGDVALSAVANTAATIGNGSGSGNSAVIDLGGANRTLTVANGAAAADVTITVPVTNGGLTKAGAGTLALTGVNTYSGDTIVDAGKLILGTASLANAADVYITHGALLELNTAGATDVIDSLFLGGQSVQAGVWGAVGSGAQFTSELLAGTGFLQVSTFIPPPLGGDYNEDGTVDAADYAVWRDALGGESSLPNDDTPGVGQDDYERWRTNFGMTSAGGGAFANGSVPEPSTLVAACIAGSAFHLWFARRRGCSAVKCAAQ